MPNNYLPKTVSHSSKRRFKECPWSYFQRYVNGIESIYKNQLPLFFGSGIHKALEKWYIPGSDRGMHPVDGWVSFFTSQAENPEYTELFRDQEKMNQQLDLGVNMLEGYLHHWGEDRYIHVIANEQRFKWGIPYVGPNNQQLQRDLIGAVDLVYQDMDNAGRFTVMEHKTASKLGSENTQYLPLDEQATLYLAVVTKMFRDQGILRPDEFVQVIVYNYLRKEAQDLSGVDDKGVAHKKPERKHYEKELLSVPWLTEEKIKGSSLAELKSLAEEHEVIVYGDPKKVQPSPRFVRKTTSRTKQEIKDFIYRLQSDLTLMRYIEEGILAPTKSPSSACCRCELRELCKLDEQGRMDMKKLPNLYKRRW